MPKKYKKSTIIKEGQDRVDSDESRHYVDKAAFYQALVERTLDIKEAELHNLPKPNISNYIGECIMKIATNLAKKHQFSGYSFKDEMIADAVYHCLKYLDAFDITKSENPFSYFTQAAYYQFLKRIEMEKMQTYVKCKATIGSAVFGELSKGDEFSNDEHTFDNIELDTDFMDLFISDYETKLERKEIEKNEKLQIKKEQKRKELNKNGLDFIIEQETD